MTSQEFVDFWPPSSAGDYPEDFEHENGNYFNTCCICKCNFRGHKRRGFCKKCRIPMVILRCHTCKNTTDVPESTEVLEKVYCGTCREWHMRLFWIELSVPTAL